MYLCFFCIGAIYYVIILVIYSYSSTVLAFVKTWILKSVFEASWCPLTVGAISFFPLYCCAFLFPCIYYTLPFFAVFTIWQHNGVFSQDIYCLHSYCCMFYYMYCFRGCRFSILSKSETLHWPFSGWLFSCFWFLQDVRFGNGGRISNCGNAQFYNIGKPVLDLI